MRPATSFKKRCDIETLRELDQNKMVRGILVKLPPPKNQSIGDHWWHMPQFAASQFDISVEKNTTHEVSVFKKTLWSLPNTPHNWAFRPILYLLQALKHLFMFCGVFGLHLGLSGCTCSASLLHSHLGNNQKNCRIGSVHKINQAMLI